MFIRISLQADDRLWREAFELGSYDILMKPFGQPAVMKTLQMAWTHWEARRILAPKARVRGSGG